MKDLPMFTTENGVASLTLREIPHQGIAYVKLQASQEPLLLLEECVSFCRMVGAQNVYAAGHECLASYPLHTAIWKLRCLQESLGETDAALWPVQEDTVAQFRTIYNEKVARIPNAAWMTQSDEAQMLAAGEGYFVHRGETLLGIGRVRGDEIRFLASLQPGAGEDVVKALAHAVTTDAVTLEVASANEKALGLYQRLGFIKTDELSRWYRVL